MNTITKQQPINFGFAIKAIVIIFTIMAFATISHAGSGYECEMMQDGTCHIYLEDVLDDNATLDDALAYCDYHNGVYHPEEDVCVLNEHV